jgi:hypothetical protein
MQISIAQKSITEKYFEANNLQPFNPGLKNLYISIFPPVLVRSSLKFEKNAVSKNIKESHCIMSIEKFHVFNDFYVIFKHCQDCGEIYLNNNVLTTDFIFIFIEIL